MKNVNLLRWGIFSLALITGSTPSFAQQEIETKVEKQKTEWVHPYDGNLEPMSIEGHDFQVKAFKIQNPNPTNAPLTEAEEFKKKKRTSNKPFLGVGIEAVEAGIKITEIYDFSAAAAAGLLSNDIITAIDGEQTSSIKTLQTAIAKHQVGDQIKISYIRNTKAATTTARLKTYKNPYLEAKTFKGHPKDHSLNLHQDKNYNRRYKVDQFSKTKEDFDACKELDKLSAKPFIGVYINMGKQGNAAVVSSTIDGTDAPDSGLSEGDEIIKINRFKVNDFNSLQEALSNFEAGESVRIKYTRNGKNNKTSVTLSSMGDRYPYKMMKLEKLCADQESTKEVIAKENIKSSKLDLSKGTTLNVFPNPAEAIVNLSFEGGMKAKTTILVLDLQGKEVMRQQINENPEQFNIQLDLSKLSSGAYIVSVLQADQVTSQQISLK